MGETARTDSGGRNCAAEDGLGVTVAGCAEIPESGCEGQDAFSGIFRGGREAADCAQGERARVRYAKYRLRGVGRFRGASPVVGSGSVSPRKPRGPERVARNGCVLDRSAD